MKRTVQLFFLTLLGVVSLSFAPPAQAQTLGEESVARPDSTGSLTTEANGTDTQLEGGGSYQNLTNNFASWKSAYLEGSYRPQKGQTYYGRLRYLNEYSINDGDFFAGTYQSLLPRTTLVVEGSIGFAQRITPQWSLFGQLQQGLGNGWAIWSGLRHSVYTSQYVELLSGTVEKYFSSFRATATIYESRGSNKGWGLPSYAGRLDYYYGLGSVVGVGGSVGQELNRIRTNDLAFFNTKTFYILGRHWFTDSWALSYELPWHRQSTLYNRYGIRLGLRHRF